MDEAESNESKARSLWFQRLIKAKKAELSLGRKGKRLSNAQFVEYLANKGVQYSAQTISNWLHENIDEVPDPLQMSGERLAKLALAFDFEPEEFYRTLLEIKGEESIPGEEQAEKKMADLLNELEELIQRQVEVAGQIKRLREIQENPDSMTLSAFLQKMLAEYKMTLQKFALLPDNHDQQWDADDAADGGRLWQIVHGYRQATASDYAAIAVCCQYLTDLSYSAEALYQINQGVPFDELGLERLHRNKRKCLKP